MKPNPYKKQPSVLPALSFKAAQACLLTLVLLTTGLLTSVFAQVNSQEQAIFNSMKSAPGQGRPTLVLDPVLCKVARQKAADMANRGYFAHVDPSGRGANYLVRQAGYSLPAGYDESMSGNNIESLSAGRDTASWTWSDWMTSAPHKQHLMGQAAFYAQQTHVGVGFVNIPGSEWQWYWVVITAPPSGPMVQVSSPEPKATVNEPSVTVAGTTSGDPGAASVQVRAENSRGNGSWITASGKANWTAKVDGLTAGDNVLRVRSLNGGGEVLKEATRTVRYVVLAPVTINVQGSGDVTKGFAGTTQREVGRSYTITATAKPGSIFRNWSGTVNSPAATITVVPVESGLTLTANFAPNPFPAGTGAYNTAFVTSSGAPGFLNVTLASNGTFTGRVRVDGMNQTFKGRFDGLGGAQVTIKGANGVPYTLALNYSAASGAAAITGSILGNGWNTDLSLDALAKAGTTANPKAGRYTLIVPAVENSSAELPAGDGAATVVVTDAGTVKVTGVLADGKTFSVSSRLTANHHLNLFAAPYAGKGFLIGDLNFSAQATSDMAGTVYWSRPANAKALAFAGGFNLQTTAVGSRYEAPAGEAVVPVASGENNTALALGDGGLAEDIVQPTTLTEANTLTITAPAVTGLTAKLSPASGIFTGTFVHPVTKKSTTFRGAILQKQGAGFGFFVAGPETGYATFAPAQMQSPAPRY